MTAAGTMDACTKCGQHTYVMPLHDERGGPLFCFMCAGAWHAEHGRRRRAGRVVVKALRGYEEAGGDIYGFDELKLAAGGMFVPYEADTAGADFRDLTSELLEATIALTHPDKHPPERKAEANRVTQELQALKPFVFPAPPPEPPPKPRDACSNDIGDDFEEPSPPAPPAYPCEACRDAIPIDYCDPCRTQWDKKRREDDEREEKERERKNARQRKRYEVRRERWLARQRPAACATCGEEFEPKRSDAKYCSHACRQRAYVKRDGKLSNSKPLGPDDIERTIEAAFTTNPDSTFTSDDLCERVYAGLKRPERKHRAAVIAIAKKVCERLETWDWMRADWRGGASIFWNRVSVTSYAMARIRSESWNRNASEKDLKAKLSARDSDYHKYVVKGGAWWEHCQEDIAHFRRKTARQNAADGDSTSRHV